MAEVIDFNSRKNGQSGATEAKPKLPKHEFTVTFKPDMENRYPEVKKIGYLSLGPVFAAIVDEKDMIEIVVAADEVLYIEKGRVVADDEVLETREVQLEMYQDDQGKPQVRVLQPGTPEHAAALLAQVAEKPIQ